MYPFLFGIAFLQQLRPYFRKHISNRLDSHEYIFLNTFVISIIVCVYLAYLFFSEQHSVTKMFTKYMKLTTLEYVCIIILALLTVASSFVIFHLDKNFNTPLLNIILLKSIGLISLIVISVCLFNEKYSMYQILGICIILFGMYLVSIAK